VQRLSWGWPGYTGINAMTLLPTLGPAAYHDAAVRRRIGKEPASEKSARASKTAKPRTGARRSGLTPPPILGLSGVGSIQFQ